MRELSSNEFPITAQGGCKTNPGGGVVLNAMNKVWVKCVTVADYLDVSRDTIERRAIEWDDKVGYVPHRFRYRLIELNEGKPGQRRYYFADAEAFLRNPPSRRKGTD